MGGSFTFVQWISIRCYACRRPSRSWITFNRFLTIFQAFVPHFYMCCTHCFVCKSLLNNQNSVYGGMFKLNAKCDADWLIYSLSNFECKGHTVQMHTRLAPPLTNTVKSQLSKHADSSPLSLAARLHSCHANHSRYMIKRLDRPHI